MQLNLNTLTTGGLDLGRPASNSSGGRLAEAAKQFESLLISQMLKSAREGDGGGWLSDGDETGEDSSMSMAEDQLAKSLAASGGFGIARTIVQKMSFSEAIATDPSGHSVHSK